MNYYQAIEIPEDCTLHQLLKLMETDNVVWNLDEAIAPVLRSLGSEACKKLWENKQVFLRPYRIRYVPGKVFIIYYGRWKLRLYGLERYFPESEPPESYQELQNRLNRLITAFYSMGIEPDKLTSPIAVYEKHLRHMNLPVNDMPPEAALYAYMCSGNLWIEAYQIGHWKRAFDYDIKSAFPQAIRTLIDTRHLNWTKSDKYEPDASYGYCRCTANITADINPITAEQNGRLETRIGKRRTFLTKHQIDFIHNYSLGVIKIHDGWWGMPGLSHPRPLANIVDRLLHYKEHTDPTVRDLAKAISVGMYGKFGETRPDEFGNLFNACWFAETSTQVALQVAKAIYDLHLQRNLIATSVDGLLLDTPIAQLPGWKHNYTGEAIVVSSGMQIINSKRPRGFSLEELKDMIAKDPYTGYYEKTTPRPVTLGEAVASGRIQDVGIIVSKVNSIDLYTAEHDRIFNSRPLTGDALLHNTYRSQARRM